MIQRLARTALSVSALLFAGAAAAEPMLGLIFPNALVPFNSETPVHVGPTHPVTGIAAGQSLGAIAVREANHSLYGLGVNGLTVQLYRIDVATYTAMAVGPALLTSSTSSNFSLDINPVADTARVVSDSGASLRLNVSTGALVMNDTSLTYAPGSYDNTPVTTGIAYSNKVLGATTTTLYALEYRHDRLFTIGGVNGIPSPNGGVMTEVGAFSDFANNNQEMGFDISPAGDALAVMTPGSVPTLYRVALNTGHATLIGVFPASTPMRDLVFAKDIPEFDSVFANGFEP